MGDDETHELITTQMTLAATEAIPEVLGSIKTTFIKMFNECYIVVTEVVAAIATTSITTA